MNRATLGAPSDEDSTARVDDTPSAAVTVLISSRFSKGRPRRTRRSAKEERRTPRFLEVAADRPGSAASARCPNGLAKEGSK